MVRIQVVLSEEDFAKLKELADRKYDGNISKTVREIIREYFRKHNQSDTRICIDFEPDELYILRMMAEDHGVEKPSEFINGLIRFIIKSWFLHRQQRGGPIRVLIGFIGYGNKTKYAEVKKN